MAENTINDFNTLPEQVQINKEDIKTNTADITKLKDDISKIKPNAWEQRKFNIDFGEEGESTLVEFTSFNPITDANIPVNNQKAFISKDNYLPTDSIGSYSGIASTEGVFFDAICIDPSTTFREIIFNMPSSTKNGLVLVNNNTIDAGKYKLYINSFYVKTDYLKIDETEIDQIVNRYSTSASALLTANAINQFYLEKSDASNTYLSKTDASNTYLTKTDASNTYATKTELSNANKRIDALDTGRFDIDLTTPGLEKIKANVTIGTPITLTKDTDFSEYIDGVDTYKTILFSIYTDQSEDSYISIDIKLDVGYTADVYGDNDQYYTWLTGIGVIKLGPDTNGNNYLCYISYSQGYTSPLVITPIQKLS